MNSKEAVVLFLAAVLLPSICVAGEKICPVVFFGHSPQNIKGNLTIDVDDVWPTNGWITELTFDKEVKILQVRNGQKEKCNENVCTFENENYNRVLNEKIIVEFEVNNVAWDKPNVALPRVIDAKIASKTPQLSKKLVWYDICKEPEVSKPTAKPIEIPTCDEFYHIDRHLDNGHGCSFGYEGFLNIGYSKQITGFRFSLTMSKWGGKVDLGGVDNHNRQEGKVFVFKSYDDNARIKGNEPEERKKLKLKVDWVENNVNWNACKEKPLPVEIKVMFHDEVEILCQG